MRLNKFVLAGLSASLFSSAAFAAPGAYCKLPGENVSEDAAGDSLSPAPGHDVASVSVAELPAGGGAEYLVVTLKVDPLSPTATPNTVYYVTFTTSDGVGRFFSFDTSAAAVPDPAGVSGAPFEYGHLEVLATGNGNFVTDGELHASSNAAGDGTITMVLPKEAMPLDTGTFMTNVLGEARVLIGTSVSGGLVSTVDDSADNPGTYEIRGSESCTASKSLLGGIVGGALSPMFLLGLFGLAAFRRRAR